MRPRTRDREGRRMTPTSTPAPSLRPAGPAPTTDDRAGAEGTSPPAAALDVDIPMPGRRRAARTAPPSRLPQRWEEL
jgi:hypothetical protein